MYKIIGAIVGYLLLFNILGAFIGYFIGSSIDRAKDLGLGGINPLSNGLRKQVFLETTFTLMGKLAKIDGHISKDEISHVEQFISKFGMTAEHRKQAIQQFKKGSTPDFDISQTLDSFMDSCGQTSNLKQVLLMYLSVMALADGQLHPSEEALLKSIANRLGYSSQEFQQMLEMLLNQAHFSQGQGNGPIKSASQLSDAYKALGVTENNTDQEIKRAYRKLMSQNHPDKLIGQGLPDDMIAVATEKSQEIQRAYELIKKHRAKS
jgi:DnaJ like chaperone protein